MNAKVHKYEFAQLACWPDSSAWFLLRDGLAYMDTVYCQVSRATVERIPPHANLYHATLRNANGTPLRARANGALRLWIRDPLRFRLPIMRGLYEYGTIEHHNCHNWYFAP